MHLDYDMMAKSFDGTRNSDPRMLKAVAAGVAGLIGKNASVLDVGAGTGRFLLPMRDEGMRVVGVDISRGMIAKAMEKGLDDLVQGDAGRLPFKDASFDAVFATNVLHLVPDWRRLIMEACRVARRALLSVDIGRSRDDPYSVFRSIMEEKGFEIPKAGPFETELADSCPPENRIALGVFEEVKTRDEFLSAFAAGTFTFQAGLTEAQKEECVKEMARRYDSPEVRFEWRTSLMAWDSDALARRCASITFPYP